MRVNGDVDQAVEVVVLLDLAAFLADRFAEQLEVHVVADALHVAVLLTAHDVAGAAQFEVAHRDLVAAAEFRVFADRGKAFLLHFGEHLVFAEGEIGVGASGASADAAAQLVKLGKSHAVGVFDDQGVGVGQIDAGLDDGRADEDIRLLLEHGAPHLAELVLLHLAVTDGDPRVGDRFLQRGGAAVDGFDAVVQIKDLTAAAQLAPDGFVDHRVVVFEDVGLHRLAVDRGFLDHAHVAQAAHRHVEGARNGRCGKGEHVDVLDELLEAFLLRHAEALFLVDDRQSQIAEHHVLLHQTVGADRPRRV